MIENLRKSFLRRMVVCMTVFFFAAALGAQTTPAPTPPAVAPAAPVPDWKSYSYPTDGFSATFPFEPSVQKNNVPTDAGTFELRAYLAEEGEAALFVGVCDYGSAVSGRDPATVLEGAKKGAIDNVKAHLISENKITLGIYPGVEFVAENDTMHFNARVFLVGTTLYQTLTAAPLSKPYAGVTRFLDSFQLIARVKN